MSVARFTRLARPSNPNPCLPFGEKGLISVAKRSHVYRAFVDVQRRLFESLIEGRVGVAGAGQVFG